LYTAALPGIGGVIKDEPEAFVVEEIPAYLPAGDGDHLYLWVQKRDVSAGRLLDVVAKHFGVSRDDIGCAGNKDRRAVTRQWLSIPAAAAQGYVPGPIDDAVVVLDAALHRNKLKTNHLRGNRFTLEIRDVAVDDDEALLRAQTILDVLDRDGVPNYFGTQRFGRGGSTLEMGIELLRGEMPPRLRSNRQLRRLAASAVQSAIFNDVLQRRLVAGTAGTALVGDRLNRAHERGQLVVTADNQPEAQTALDRGDLVVTGPMWGPKMYDVYDEALALETAAVTALGLEPRHFEQAAKLTPGTRRDLFARFLEAPRIEPIPGGVRVGFSLPSGAYATVVLAELTKLDFSEWEAP